MPWEHQERNAGRSKRGRQDVQRVEPAARLTDVLSDDEVARVVVLEPLLVLEKGSAPARGIEPDSNQQSNTSN